MRYAVILLIYKCVKDGVKVHESLSSNKSIVEPFRDLLQQSNFNNITEYANE